MSTPSSSPMPLDQAPELSQPALSEPQRIINTFIAPSKTLADLKRKSGWWVPFLVLALSAVGFIFAVNKKVGAEAVVNNRFEHASFLQRVTSQVPPERRQAMIDDQVRSQNRSVYWVWLNILVAGLVYAALLMATFNFGFDAQVKYKTALAIVYYGWLPKLVYTGLAIIVMIVGVEPEGFDLENPVATNLGALLGSNTDHRFLYRLLSGVDLISLWTVFLIGLGFALLSAKRISTTVAVITVTCWYIVFILLRGALAPMLS